MNKVRRDVVIRALLSVLTFFALTVNREKHGGPLPRYLRLAEVHP